MSTESGNRAPYIVPLSIRLAERIQHLVERKDSPYDDLGDFLTVAAENLLMLESSSRKSGAAHHATLAATDRPPTHSPALSDIQSLVAPPPTEPPTRDPRPGTEPLFVLTNRLSPMVATLRVLANMTKDEDSTPHVQDFIAEVGQRARLIGFWLKDCDDAEGLKGAERRAVGWPIGDSADKAVGRFLTSFALSSQRNSDGPLVDCGLAVVEDGKTYLTPLGLKIAFTPSPLFGECDGSTLSPEQQVLFREAIQMMHGELKEVRQFLSAVETCGGLQSDVDALLHNSHSNWSKNRITAHRAALIGRLRELSVVDVEGRGAAATIRLLPPASEFKQAGNGGARRQ